MPSLFAAALVGALALASAAGSLVLALGVLVLQGLFALGAVRQFPVPGSTAAAWLSLGAGAASSAWLVAEEIPNLTPVARVLAGAFLVAVLLQMWRRHGRPLLTASMSFTVAAMVLAVLPASLVALRTTESGGHAVWLGLLGVGAVLIVDGLGGHTILVRMLAVLGAGVLAVGLVMLVDFEDVPQLGAVALAVFGALLGVAALYATDRLAAADRFGAPQDGSGAAQDSLGGGTDVLEAVAVDMRPLLLTLPVIMAAPVMYLLGRLLLG